jgi:hypothetical protein
MINIVKVPFSGWVEFLQLSSDDAAALGFSSAVYHNNRLIDAGPVKPICLNPLKLVLAGDHSMSGFYYYVVLRKGLPIVRIDLNKAQCFKAGNSSFTVFELSRSGFYASLGLTRVLFYLFKLRLFKNPVRYRYYWDRASLFFEPRDVVLVSVKCGEFESVFPMDLQLRDDKSGIHLLGLRKSNAACRYLGDPSVRIAVADAPFSQKKLIYELGASHYERVKIDTATAIRTENHQNVFPSLITTYFEMELLFHEPIGQQELIVCRVKAVKRIGPPAPILNHLHSQALV